MEKGTLCEWLALTVYQYSNELHVFGKLLKFSMSEVDYRKV